MSDRDAFVKDLITDPLQWLFNELHENWSFDLGEDCSPRAQGSTLDPRIEMYARSPLEAKFQAWWDAKFIYEGYMGASNMPTVLWLRSQVDIKAGGHTYRVDFVPVYDEPRVVDQPLDPRGIHWEHRDWNGPLRHPFIAVELDGHDYHERTRAQVRHRDRRDRDLQAAGWRLMHFSGSEFHRNPAKCVDEVWSASWGTRVDGRRIPDRITVDYQEMFPCPTE